MPTPIAHIAASSAAGLTVAAVMRFGIKDAARLTGFCAAAAVIPDFDSLAAFLPNRMQPIWGHRGIFHSPFFGVMLALVLSRVFTMRSIGGGKGPAAFLAISISGILHAVMDAMTDSGLGVMLYAPFDFGRHFLPWRIIHAQRPETLAGIGIVHVLAAVKSELVLWIICMTYCVIPYAAIRRKEYG